MMELRCSLRTARGQLVLEPDVTLLEVLERKPKLPPGNPKMMTPLVPDADNRFMCLRLYNNS